VYRISAMAFPLLCFVAPAFADIPGSCLDFSHYPASGAIHEPYAEPKVDASPEASKFRTVIKLGSNGAPNFAGRFRVVEWGCGSPCHSFALVDKESGDIHMVNVSGALGARFQIDSNLFVVDPPEMIEADWPEGMAAPISYLWDSSTHTLQPIPGCNGYTQKSRRRR